MMQSHERPLTGKQAAWIRWYTTPGETFYNATRSAEKAGYSGQDGALGRTGFDNTRNPKIQRQLEQQITETHAAVGLSYEKVLRDLEHTRLLAISKGDLRSAVKVSELQGRYLGMFSSKVQCHHALENCSLEELVGQCNQLVEKIDGLNTLVVA